MKICFITNNIFTLGGVQRVVSVLANELNKEHTVEILCLSDHGDINRDLYDLDASIKVDIKPELVKTNILSKSYRKLLKDLNKNIGIFNNEKMCKKLVEIYFPIEIQKKILTYLNNQKYDAIIGVEGLFSILLGLIKEKLDAKTIGWQHNSYDAYLKNKGKYYWNMDILFEKYISNLNKYIVLTEYDKEMFKKEKQIECKVIHNPKSFISKEKSDLTKKQFLAAGRFNYQKGFDLLIESFNLFAQTNSEWNLVIVGEGENEKFLKNKIKEYGLNDRILIKGFTDNIKSYFLNSSVLLLSSRWEGMPMIVLESLEMGVPIVSYDITASKQLIDNKKNGVLVDKFDVKMFANAMLELSSSYELRKKMSLECIKQSRKYSIDKIVEVWNKVLKKI